MTNLCSPCLPLQHHEQVKDKTDEEKAKEFEEYFGCLAAYLEPEGSLKVCGNRPDLMLIHLYNTKKRIWTNSTDFDCVP